MKKTSNNFYTTKLSSAIGDPKATYQIINSLFDKQFGKKKLPKAASDLETAENFKELFSNKVANIYQEIELSHANKDYESEEELFPKSSENNRSMASHFKLVLPNQLHQIIKSMANKTCWLDPIPTWIFKKCFEELLSLVTIIVNLSLQTDVFPASLKQQ